jgi:DNA-binding GntR family transcriptional regulator
VLDGLATRLAAPNLRSTDHARLNEILSQMDAAVEAKDTDRLLAINRDFHEVIWQAAHAPRLQVLLQNLYDASQRFRNISLLLPGRIDQITQDHRLITQALAQNNVADAERFAIEHHEGTARRLLNTFERKKKQAE